MAKDNEQATYIDLSKPLDLERQKLTSSEVRRRIDALFEANGKLSNEHPRLLLAHGKNDPR